MSYTQSSNVSQRKKSKKKLAASPGSGEMKRELSVEEVLKAKKMK